jgi:hypothetical protein
MSKHKSVFVPACARGKLWKVYQGKLVGTSKWGSARVEFPNEKYPLAAYKNGVTVITICEDFLYEDCQKALDFCRTANTNLPLKVLRN